MQTDARLAVIASLQRHSQRQMNVPRGLLAVVCNCCDLVLKDRLISGTKHSRLSNDDLEMGLYVGEF